jgi:glycosyltransferase involved in cell wall biosynthesis
VSSAPWELILIDNGSRDHTHGEISDFAKITTFPVIFGLEPTPGLGIAHNKAISLPRGAIMAIIDDDCYLSGVRGLRRSDTAGLSGSLVRLLGRKVRLYDTH